MSAVAAQMTDTPPAPMAKVELPYVQALTDRHGRRRHYFRRAGFARVTLPGEPGSDVFMAAYAAALAASRPGVEARIAARIQPRSIEALLIEYYRSPEWAALRDSTRRGYRSQLERFRTRWGQLGAVSVQAHHIEAILHGMAATPGAAKNLRKRLRRLFRLAVRLGWRADNPVNDTEAPRHKVKGFTAWSEDDIAAFEKRWPAGSRERRALYLLLYTGQRRSDVVTMGRQHVRDGRIAVCQLKTSARLRIRIHPALQAELDRVPATDMTYMTTRYGAPFSAAGFSQWFRDAAVAAGLTGRTAHGLRKAAGRRLAEAGCSAKQIAAVLGHTTLDEVERYTRDADQARLADDAMARLEAITRTPAVNPASSRL
jgi:integrase